MALSDILGFREFKWPRDFRWLVKTSYKEFIETPAETFPLILIVAIKDPPPCPVFGERFGEMKFFDVIEVGTKADPIDAVRADAAVEGCDFPKIEAPLTDMGGYEGGIHLITAMP
jgi:hypothetical protein